MKTSSPYEGGIQHVPFLHGTQCEARCRKSGKRCPHICNSQVPSTFAHHPILDSNYFTVNGRPAHLCESHYLSFRKRAKSGLSIALIEGGHLSPFNKHGFGSVVMRQDRLFFGREGEAIRIAPAWGWVGWRGKVPEGLLDRIPHYHMPTHLHHEER